jgi:hypothetical protein
MFIENLSEHEIGTMIAALKHFRASRASARRDDRSASGDTVNELLIKLEGSLLSSLTAMDPALHGLVFTHR